MTREERDELHKAMNEVAVEPTEPMNLEQIQAFVKGYELAYLNILGTIDKAYRDMKTDQYIKSAFYFLFGGEYEKYRY